MTSEMYAKLLSYLDQRYGDKALFRGMTLEAEELKLILKNGLSESHPSNFGIYNWSGDPGVAIHFVTGGLNKKRDSGIFTLLVMKKPIKIPTIEVSNWPLPIGQIVHLPGANARHFMSGGILRDQLIEILVFNPLSEPNRFPFVNAGAFDLLQ